MLDERIDFERGMPYFPRVAAVIIVLNLVVFGVEAARGALGDPEALVLLGAKETAAVAAGEWWRLASCMFLHGSAGHVIGNMLGLYVVAMGCEHAFGRPLSLLAYVVGGVAGSLCSCLLPTVSVGASGAVFGLMGALSTALLRHRDKLGMRDKRVGAVLAIWAVYSLANGAISPVTDNLGHAGGLLGGIAFALCVRPRLILSAGERAKQDRMALVGLTPVVLFLAYSAAFFVPALMSSPR